MASVIESITCQRINSGLHEPFVIASTILSSVENVAVGVRLTNGVCGWGEAPCLPPVTQESPDSIEATIQRANVELKGESLDGWPGVLAEVSKLYAQTPAARAGLEVALADAHARSLSTPLHTLFGDHAARVETDITIPICMPDIALRLSRQWASRGFGVIKTKVGRDWREDIKRLEAIKRGHPEARLILDANEGFTAVEALEMIEGLSSIGVVIDLFEQPVPRGDYTGLKAVEQRSGVRVAADESCASPQDAMQIVEEGCASVLNIKLAKVGLWGAIQINQIAQDAGLGVMMGAMVETRLGCESAAHLVSGLGGVEWIDLDTHFLLRDDPIIGGAASTGSVFELGQSGAGHGMCPA